MPGPDINEELRRSIKEPRIFGADCEISELIIFLDARDRKTPQGLVGSLFCQEGAFQDFVNYCILPTVTIGRMNEIGRRGAGAELNRFFDVVTKYDIAFALLVLDDRYTLFHELAVRENKRLNVTYYLQRELNETEEKQFGTMTSEDEGEYVLYTGDGLESAGRGWSRYGVERFNFYVGEIDEFIKTQKSWYDDLVTSITDFWLNKDTKAKRKRKWDDGEKAEGGICKIQAVCGL